MNKQNDISYQTIYSSQIYLNSANADLILNTDPTDKSNVVFFFKDALKIDRNSIEMRVSIVDAQIPISWYLIDSTNNQLTIKVNGISTTYTFPNGNYNVNTFISTWASVVGNNTQWNLSFDTITNKIKFQCYISNDVSFSDSDINSMFKIIGFIPGNIYYSSISGIIYSSHCVNFSGITKINIKSNTFALKNVDSKNKGRTRTIASIPVNNASNGFIYYNNFTQYKSIFKNYELSSIGLELQDDFKNYIKFNNIDWTLTIQIDVVCEVINNIDTLEDIYFNLQQEF